MMKVVTIVGANGTMGRNIAGIFAAFGQAKVYLISRSIEKSETAKDQICLSVRADSIYEQLIAADYEQLPACVVESDLILECVAEDLEIKKEVHYAIANALNLEKRRFICTGTSGLSVTSLAALYPECYRGYFMGMHFFNPPYSMTLCEIIPTTYASEDAVHMLCEYSRNVLRRTVVKVKDEPAFLANRIGFQFINAALLMAEKYKDSGGVDYIDAILGPFTGRAMAPLTTADFVGLDICRAIIDNVYTNTSDYLKDTFIIPTYIEQLIKQNKLGRKTKGGLYTLHIQGGEKVKYVYDIAKQSYREVIPYAFPFAQQMKNALRYGDYKEMVSVLLNNQSIEAALCVEFLLNYIMYSVFLSDVLCDDISAADDVMATGFNWCPPLALADAIGLVVDVVQLAEERFGVEYVQAMQFDKRMQNRQKSKYDYRAYFKAK